VQEAAESGLSFGAPTVRENEFGELIRELVPAMEMMRLVNSGTEACMSVLRLARGFTGRNLILKFSGNYHGHADSYLVDAGSGVATQALPDSAGVPPQVANLTLVVPYNNLRACAEVFSRHGDDLAAVIVEPYCGNAGFLKPAPGFLEGLRSLCSNHGSLLIFDEVMTGFRISRSGAAGKTGVTPDLMTLGKVVGGGMPLAAYGGKAHIMGFLAPGGPVYQAGTLSGNPVATAAGMATLTEVAQLDYRKLEAFQQRAVTSIRRSAEKHGVTAVAEGEGAMFGIFFGLREYPRNFAEAKKTDRELYKKFFHGMLQRGVYLPPSPMEAMFITAALTDSDLAYFEECVDAVFRELRP
jgi:glutamate-1-semialdehyde 2,1-aminomutase